jgi:hypothetical protein
VKRLEKHPDPDLDRIFVSTNGTPEWLEEPKKRLWAKGWRSVITTRGGIWSSLGKSGALIMLFVSGNLAPMVLGLNLEPWAKIWTWLRGGWCSWRMVIPASPVQSFGYGWYGGYHQKIHEYGNDKEVLFPIFRSYASSEHSKVICIKSTCDQDIIILHGHYSFVIFEPAGL